MTTGKTAVLAGLFLATGWVPGCSGALPPAVGVRATLSEEPAGVRLAPPPVVSPVSAEAAAATKARGDAVAVAKDTYFRGSTAGLVIGRIEPATGEWFEHSVVYLPGAAVDVAVLGAVAFVSLGPTGVAVVDVSTPASPKPLAIIETPGSAMRLHLDGDRLAVAAGHAGVLLFDVADAARPSLLGSWEPEGYVRQVILDGERVIVAEGDAGVSLLAVAPGGGLRHVWRVSTGGQARAVAVRPGKRGARTIAVANGPGGLAVLAALGDEAATVVGKLALPDMARDVAFDGDGSHVFVAAGDRGVLTADIAAPGQPRIVGTLPTDKPANRLRVDGARLLVGNDSAGLLVLDAADPAALSPLFAAPPGE